MSDETKLTRGQLEILEVVWSKGKQGATVAEIWEELQKGREVARTTVLTLVQRLERRGWLAAETSERAHRFRATRPREHAQRRFLRDLVDGLFGGSPSALITSLLGSRKIERKEVEQLKALLDAKAKEVS